MINSQVNGKLMFQILLFVVVEITKFTKKIKVPPVENNIILDFPVAETL